MRITTITNWAYGATVILTAVSGTAFILSATAADQERRAVEQHLGLDDLGDALALAAEKRSDEARLYAMRGARRHLAAFLAEEKDITHRERLIGQLRTYGLTDPEHAALNAVEGSLGELDEIERDAIVRARRGDSAAAQQILFGPDHERAQTAVLEPLRRFRDLVAERTQRILRSAQARSDFFSDAAKLMLGLTAALFLSVLYFVLRRRVALPLARMTRIVARLARQDFTVEVPVDRRRDEIGDMNTAIRVFRSNGLERDRLEAERMADRLVKDSILRMMHRLQAAATQRELAEVVACFVPQTFPDVAGHLYVLDRPGTALVLAGSWLDPASTTEAFAPGICWGVRRGRPHVSNQSENDIPCVHVGEVASPSLCVPLTAQGDTIGLLYFEQRSGTDVLGETARLYVELIAENIGLALANLRLREQLTGLAIRDALTGLFNRRCLDEAINRHAREPRIGPIACLMIDIDHFKRFNDSFGHDAGDLVMQHVAGIMLEAVGDFGRAYRFGGEEFTILLPDRDEAGAMAFAETLRLRIHASPIAHRGRALGHVAVSIGVAAYPEIGAIANLIGCADAALLSAKMLGRNQVMSASQAGANGTERSVA